MPHQGRIQLLSVGRQYDHMNRQQIRCGSNCSRETSSMPDKVRKSKCRRKPHNASFPIRVCASRIRGRRCDKTRPIPPRPRSESPSDWDAGSSFNFLGYCRNLTIHDQYCLMMLKWEFTPTLQKARMNSRAGHGLGSMSCYARLFSLGRFELSFNLS